MIEHHHRPLAIVLETRRPDIELQAILTRRQLALAGMAQESEVSAGPVVAVIGEMGRIAAWLYAGAAIAKGVADTGPGLDGNGRHEAVGSAGGLAIGHALEDEDAAAPQ